MSLIHSFAKKFYDVFYQKEWSGKFLPRVSEVSIAEAYQIQDLIAKMRIDHGEEVVDFKVGCTSQAIRSQFGLQEPISGRLFLSHIYKEGVRLDWRDYIHCA